jgi:hypothetical protein
MNVGQQVIDDGPVDRLDVADQAEIAGPGAAAGPGQAAVLAGEADRAAADLIDETDDLLVEPAAQDHLDDLEGALVGDPEAVDEGRLDAEALEHAADLRAAAVNHHHLDADPVQQHHVLGEPLAQDQVLERATADLDHEGAAAERTDVGQGLDEDPGLVDHVAHESGDDNSPRQKVAAARRRTHLMPLQRIPPPCAPSKLPVRRAN